MLRWLLLFFASTSFAQLHYDTLINKGIYKSYFNTIIKQPVAVSYTLYKGGGTASINNDRFVGTEITLHDKDYLRTGYDRGHLVPAEDFAYSDSLQGITFSYYNCVPQLPKLNRGIWKKYENKVRKLSQTDTVIVVCLNEYKTWIIDGLNVPDVCYKFVYSHSGKLLFEIGLSNVAATIGTEILISEAIKKEVVSLVKFQ